MKMQKVEGKAEVDVQLVEVEMDDPSFEAESVHTATATFMNPKTAPITYGAQLYLAKTVSGPAVASSPVVDFTVEAKGTLAVPFVVTMPALSVVSDSYKVYLLVAYGGTPLVTFVGVEDVAVYITPSIQLIGIGWV